MPFSTILLDLDDTVYDRSCNLWPAIRERIALFMTDCLGMEAAQAERLRNEYLERYGTTLRGLQHDRCVDVDAYLAYVHDLPLAQFLLPNPALARLLYSLPQKRFIFTNSDAAHSQRVLRQIGLEGCVDGIIDIRALGWLCKPDPLAYRRAMELAGEDDPQRCVMIDDSLANLAPARALGMTTLWVTADPSRHPAASRAITSLAELPQALPALWDGAPAGRLLSESA